MSNNFIPSGLNNPCEICERTKDGDCRKSKDGKTILCHTNLNPSPKETINGYIWSRRENIFTGGSLEHSVWVLIQEDWEKKPKKIIHQPLSKSLIKGATTVLVKEETVQQDTFKETEVISLARYHQEPTPRETYNPEKHYIPKRVDIKRVIAVYVYKNASGAEKTRIEYKIDPNNPLNKKEEKRLAAGKLYDKTFSYRHIKPDGTYDYSEGSWSLYRWEEQKSSLKPNEFVLIGEGEGIVDALNALSLACLYPHKWDQEQIYIELLETIKQNNLTPILLEDNDEAGQKHIKKALQIFEKHEIDFIVLTMVYLLALAKTLDIPTPPSWGDVPPEGTDIKDLIDFWQQYFAEQSTVTTSNTEANNTMSNQFVQESLVKLLTEAIRQKRAEMALSQINVQTPPSSDKPDSSLPLDTINQKVCHELYGDSPWICVKGNLYKWVGTHYELRKTVEEERRIRDYLNFYSVKGKYPYANPSSVRSCLSWVRITYSISPDKINPPGINCLNGVVRINWVDFKPTPELIPHSPDQYYISEPTFKYAPDADSTDCLRLLEALEPMERTIFLKTVAASLDLPMVRKRWGRLVRALLCFGDGSNGKDALRECVFLIHGAALTACSLNDFQGYDRGRKFPLARLSPARINWSSENILHGKLDGVQSLKSAITGEQLSCEPKGKDEEEFTPKCVFLFNCNELPKVQGHQQAFASRYGILKFNKTFKIGANIAAGELEADPRFKYDPSFLKAQVMPAFLNIVLAELGNLMSEGINYSCVEKAMSEARAESNHLFQACQDIGLVAAKGEEILLKDVWESLYNWYLENKYLEEITDGQKTKKVWTTDVDKSDPLVKAPKDLCTRLKTVFGNSLKTRTGHGRSTYLVGVKFQTIELAQNLVHPEKPQRSPANDYTPQLVASPVASTEQNLLHHQKPELIQDNDYSHTSIDVSSTSPESNLLHPNPNNEPTVLTTVDQRESAQIKVGDIGTLETDPIKFLYAEVCKGFKFRIVDIESNGFIRVEEINGKSPILQVRTSSIHRRQFFPIG